MSDDYLNVEDVGHSYIYGAGAGVTFGILAGYNPVGAAGVFAAGAGGTRYCIEICSRTNPEEVKNELEERYSRVREEFSELL